MPNYREELGIPTRDSTPRKQRLNPSQIRAKKQEREVAKRLQGRLTPASGAKEEKGDVRVRGVARIECKTTKHKSFSVTLEMAQKIEEAAISTGEMPILLIEFIDDTGKPLGELAVVPSYLLEELCQSKES